jgi:parallel beta-helix repeat protein
MKRVIFGLMLTLLTVGMLPCAFNIRSAKGVWAGTVYIQADGSIDPPDAPITTYDNVTYTLTDNITSTANGIVVERDNIVIDGAGYTVQGTGVFLSVGIDMNERNNVTVKNTRISGFGIGILLALSIGNTISGNIITNNSWSGIQVEESTRNILSGNTNKNNSIGINIGYSDNNTVLNNTIANSSSHQIQIIVSYGNILSGNSVTNSSKCGIYFTSSNGNTVSLNDLQQNEYGIYLDYSRDNLIYHNNFINNTDHAVSGLWNIWDDGYPSGGNYWSDYVDRYPDAKELDGSDLWDTPYVIDENNQDRYPLMYAYGTQTYKLTITTTSGGTTAPSPGTHTYADGAIAEVTAIPNDGYSFDYWLLDGNVRTENPITMIMDSNHTLEAYFVDDIPPEISEPWQDPPPGNVQPFQNVTVTVNVTDFGTDIKDVTLWYIINNGTTWTPLNMTEISVGTYQAIIQGYENCTWVTYKIIAYDNAGNNATKDNNGYGYKYHVIPEFPSTPILILLMLTTLIKITLWKTKRKPQPP